MRIEWKRRLRVSAAFVTTLPICCALLLISFYLFGWHDEETRWIFVVSIGAILLGRYLAALLPEALRLGYRVIAGVLICLLLEAAACFFLLFRDHPERLMWTMVFSLVAGGLSVPIIWSSLKPWRNLRSRIFWTVFDTIGAIVVTGFAIIAVIALFDRGVLSAIYVWQEVTEFMLDQWEFFSLVLCVCAGLIIIVVLADHCWLPRVPYQERRAKQ